MNKRVVGKLHGLPAGFGKDVKADISAFAPKLQGLCAATLADNRSPDAAGEMIEALLSSLAFTIAMATGGNPKRIDDMCHGASLYLLERCADHQKAGKALGHIMKTELKRP